MSPDDDPAAAILGRRWRELTADFARIVAGVERRVVRWERVPRPGGNVHYGFDDRDRVRIERRVIGGTAGAPVADRDEVWVESSDGRLVGLEYRYDGVEPVVLKSITVPTYEGDELHEVLRLGAPGADGPRDRERYERRGGRLVRIVAEVWSEGAWVPTRQYECRYADDELASVIATRLDELDAKPIVIYRRSAPRAVRAAHQRIRDELPSRIEAWMRRVAPHEPLFALALVYSLDGPAVPPAVGLVTERERRALRASAPHDRERIWRPAGWEILDRAAPELLADGLDACWRQLAREWEQASDDHQPRALLVEVAKRLAGLPGSPDSPRAVYAVDDRLADLDRNLPATVREALESAGR